VKIVADFEDGDTRTIDRDGKKDEVVETDIVRMLAEVTGGAPASEPRPD
jgi:hypothetical protein